MIMSEEVKQALQTLRDNATNKLEQHRIDLLERDLTDPPRVEVVDEEHQRFLGITFRKRSNGYFYSPNLSIYRLVWCYYHGELPGGMVIHHVDHNKNNNTINNLIALTNKDHAQSHGKLWHQQAMNERNQRRLAKPYNGSGIRQCAVCSEAYYYDAHNSKRKTCSAECEHILRHKKNSAKKVNRSRICEVCGKSFEYKHKCQKTCSPSCGKILSARTLKQRRAQ